MSLNPLNFFSSYLNRETSSQEQEPAADSAPDKSNLVSCEIFSQPPIEASPPSSLWASCTSLTQKASSFPVKIVNYANSLLTSQLEERPEEKPVEIKEQFKTLIKNREEYRSFLADFNVLGEKREIPSKANVGLGNLVNTCWLNSALKFLATDDMSDLIFARTDEEIKEQCNSHPNKDDEIQRQMELRDNIKLIMEELRQPTGENLNELYIKSLIEILTNYSPDFADQQQMDPADFLQLLTNLFEYTATNPSSVPNLVTTYSHDSLKKPPLTERFVMPLAQAENPFIYEGDKIDLSKCMNPAEEVRSLTSEDGQRGEFTLQTHLTNAPDKLCIQVGRLGMMGRCDDAVMISDDLEVSISSYQINATGQFESEQKHLYLITGAIIHHVVGEEGGGHYSFLEKVGGRFFYHDDMGISEQSREWAKEQFEKATIFKLQKITASHN